MVHSSRHLAALTTGRTTMGRIDYQVLVDPLQDSPLAQTANSKKTLEDIENVVEDIRHEWACIGYDKVKPSKVREMPLVYETDEALFQVLVTIGFQEEEIYFSLRFAYYNPPSIYTHFCDFIVWLMERYRMYCAPMRPLVSPDAGAIGKPYAISDIRQIRPILIPSMEYMHDRWRNFAGNETLKISPEEARIYLRNHYHAQYKDTTLP